MLKHARAGVPLEVMGLLIGEVIDDYAIKVVDVFAMPQSGTSVSVESVDPVYQQDMLDMLKQTQRTEVVVGWYHSHPSFGCWLSSVDINTQVIFIFILAIIRATQSKVCRSCYRSDSICEGQSRHRCFPINKSNGFAWRTVAKANNFCEWTFE